MSISTAAPTRSRRRFVEQLARRSGVVTRPDIGYDARLLYVATALRCGDDGRIPRSLVAQVLVEPSTLQMAETILAKLGCPRPAASA